MQKTTKIIISLVIFLMLVAPVSSFAQTSNWKGLIPCSNTSATPGTVTPAKPCNFTDFLNLIDKIIKFVLYYLVLPIAAIMFAYAGFKLVTSGGSTEARGQAKNIFTHAVLGVVIAAGAWLVIKMILSILGFDGAWIGFK